VIKLGRVRFKVKAIRVGGGEEEGALQEEELKEA